MTSASETSMSQFSQDMASPYQKPGGTKSRTQSISSDRPSTIAYSVMSPPLSVSPEAAFIAAPSASQIVTNDHDNHADTWYDQHGFQPSGESVVVSPAALRHLNKFLDHLLYNFLAQSGSTALANLRPAVSEVLKPKLAKDAIRNADEELREYLGGEDDDEFLDSPTTASSRDWDLELVWKRTRLRCMVYSSLGDMEEEDEDHHMEEGLLGDDDEIPGSNVSPAVAIFLTSILEYLGEQALVSAGQAVWNRLRIKYEKEAKQSPKGRVDTVDRIVVEEVDMERVALDRTLGRLWRAWKKRIRSGNGSVDLSHRPVSREKMYRQRLGSLADAEDAVPPAVEESAKEGEVGASSGDDSVEKLDEDEAAAAIPLPMSERDIDEIEVPGLVFYSDDESEVEEPEELGTQPRPKSLMLFAFPNVADIPSPTLSSQHTPKVARRRANSLPTPAASPYDQRKKKTAEADQTEAPQVPDQLASEDTSPEVDRKAAVAEVTLITDKAVPEASKVQTEADAAKPQPKGPAESHEEIGDSDLEGIEEAQIMTSSRISIGGSISGRSDSPASSDRGSRPPLSIRLPGRSGSLRVVDVQSPRTPSSRSQRSSLLQQEPTNSSYSRSASRTNSVHADDLREPEDSQDLKPAGTSTIAKSRSNVAPAISEAEEMGEPKPMSATIFPRREPVAVPENQPVQSDDSDRKEPRRHPNQQPMFGSVKRHSPSSSRSTSGDVEQSQTKRSPRQKASSLSTPPNSSPTQEDSVGPLPSGYTRHSPRGPAHSESGTNRYQHAHSQSAGNQPGTIGILSVDRPASYKENGIRGSPEQAQSRGVQTPASSASSHKVRAARASQDSTATRPEEVARNFEDLIRGNETIQYTLTPENMRELEGSPRSIQSSKTRRSDDTRQSNRDHAGSTPVKPIEVRRSTSVTRATGLRSHPVDLSPSEANDKARPPVSMANRARGAAPQARDARLPRESVLEFAEFIRATGPPGAEVPAVQPNMGVRRNQSVRRDGPPPASSNKMSADQGRSSLTGSMTGSISRARLQARDATVDNSGDNSDLIDFIRRGPPSSGNHRIPRTVAPFRTTMDSDQMSSTGGGRAQDASIPDAFDTRASQASTNITDMSAPSIQSSINSQSALLGRKPGAASNYNAFDEPDMMPARKQRRVRDPYALDLSDEDDDDLDDLQPQPKRKPPPKEESLIDFLNSAPPPPPSDPVPFNLNRSQTGRSEPAQAPKKKASAPSLMARFRQGSASATPRGPKSPATSGSRSLSSRGGSTTVSKGYIPIQVNIPTGGDLFPQYGSNTAPAVPSIPPHYSKGPSGRVPMKKFEPRDAVSVPSRGTSDLAEFLRSEPPPSSGPSPWAAGEEDVQPNKLFGRRKKPTGIA